MNSLPGISHTKAVTRVCSSGRSTGEPLLLKSPAASDITVGSSARQSDNSLNVKNAGTS